MELTIIPTLIGYLASPTGDIYSLRSGAPRLLKVQMHKGYAHVYVRYGYGRAAQRKVPLHQLVLLAFKGPRPGKHHEGRHLDGNVENNLPSNLDWGTRAQNMRDAMLHGTHACLRSGSRSNAWRGARAA